MCQSRKAPKFQEKFTWLDIKMEAIQVPFKCENDSGSTAVDRGGAEPSDVLWNDFSTLGNHAHEKSLIKFEPRIPKSASIKVDVDI